MTVVMKNPNHTWTLAFEERVVMNPQVSLPDLLKLAFRAM